MKCHHFEARKILKISNFQKSIFQKYFFHCFKMVVLHWWLFSRVFKIWQWFLVQKKAEYSYFEMQKFFTPLTSFLPPFFYIEDSLKIEFEHANYQYSKQKRGVKNFCIFWSNISAFICTKNHCHILKTHENSYSGVICSNHSKSGKKKFLL